MQTKSRLSCIKGLVLIAFFSVILTSCVNYDDVEIKEISEVKLVSFSDKGLIVDSKVKLSNPNMFDIKVVDSKLDVFVKGRAIGTTKIEGKLTLPSKSEEFHTLRLKSTFKDLGKDALTNLLAITAGNNKKVDFKFEGYIVGKVFFIKRRVDISHEDSTELQLF